MYQSLYNGISHHMYIPVVLAAMYMSIPMIISCLLWPTHAAYMYSSYTYLPHSTHETVTVGGVSPRVHRRNDWLNSGQLVYDIIVHHTHTLTLNHTHYVLPHKIIHII